jgi:predicted TPR repeat methyltransferase
MLTPSARRIIPPVVVLAIFAMVLPIRSTIVGRRSTTAECLALAADAPSGAAADQLALYERCLALEPDDVELMVRLGGRIEIAGDRPRAEALYRRALTIDPGYAGARLRLGELLLRRGDRAGARAAATTALESRPNSQAAVDLLQRASGAAPGTAR